MRHQILAAVAVVAAAFSSGGCAGTGASDADDRVADAPAPSTGNARLRELREKRGLSAAERLEQAGLEAAAGELSAAESSYSAALNKGGLSRSDQHRAQMGLGRVADLRNNPHAARPRYQEAWRLAETDAQRDAALFALTEADLDVGDVAAAKNHRAAILNRSLEGLVELDWRLDAAVAGGGAPKTAPAATPAPSSAASSGVSSLRAKGRGLKPPQIVGRSTWGARAGSTRDTEPMGKPTLVTIHHTADRRPPGPAYEQTVAQMRAYQNAHQANGWADIGYHFVIDKAGRVFEGRPLHLKGAHAGSQDANEHNVGVALIGNFESSEPTAKQVEALEGLVIWVCAEYGIPDRRVYTHHQIKDWPGVKGATNCPGRKFDPYYARIKRAVAAKGSAAGATK